MPGEKLDFAEEVGPEERSRERDSEREKDKNGSKNKAGNGQAAKSKDVSHVPCKFFRLNQCSAGASCPFSHHILEPGQQKEVCQWFLKNNCKFGHKCALAHILPGQPMSMDRKNKKAAQQAAQAVSGGVGKNERRRVGGKEEGLRVGLGRGLGKSAAPISISKATISPSAPAPALQDTDFSKGLPDEKPVQARPQGESSQEDGAEPAALSPGGATSNEEKTPAPPPAPELPSTSTSPTKDAYQQQSDGGTVPVSKPAPSRGVHRPNGSTDFGFGPIGSPPRSSPAQTPSNPGVQRINGFSPSTSPNTGGLAPMPSTSPFTAPGSKSLFMAYSLDRDTSASTQIHATATTTRTTNFTGAMSLGGIRGWDIMGSSALAGGEEDDLEEFLPSSLNELLTDEERKRRLSRTGGQRPIMETQLSQHRYSRSVPAASLMDNVKNLWSENGGDMGSAGPSPSLLGTSNVSGAGFLPRRPAMNATRAFSDLPAPATGFNGPASASAAGTFGSPPVPTMFMNRTTSNPLTSTSSQQYGGLQQGRPIPGVGAEPSMFNGNPLSPTARALQEHAPGQSLPQGLAAGLSRLHIRPPLPLGTSASPHQGLAMSGSPGRGLGGLSGTDFNGGASFSAVGAASPPGLSRDAYDRFTSFAPSRAASGLGSPTGMATPTAGGTPSGLGGYRRPLTQQLTSPLARPALTNDDDVVFVME